MGMLVRLQPVDCRLDRLTQAAEELSKGTVRKTIEKFETIDFVICGWFRLPTLSYAALIWSGLLAIDAAGNSLISQDLGERFQYCVDIRPRLSGTLLTPGLTICSGRSIPSKPQFPVSANDMTRTSTSALLSISEVLRANLRLTGIWPLMSNLSARPPIPSLSALDGMPGGKTEKSEDLELILWDVALPGQLHIGLQWDSPHSERLLGVR